MSKEKKLNDYAEDRLAAYSDGEDSLARLKEAQAANAPEKAPTPWRRYGRMIVTSLSVLVVVAVAVLLVVQNFFGAGQMTDSGEEKHAFYSDAEHAAHSAPASDTTNKEKNHFEDIAVSDADVNIDTEYVRVTLPANAMIERTETGSGYYYTVSLKDGSLDAVILFGDAAAEGTAFDTDKTCTVAGQTFSYVWANGIALRGRIVTDRETICVTHCAGENEAAALDLVRSVFTGK